MKGPLNHLIFMGVALWFAVLWLGTSDALGGTVPYNTYINPYWSNLHSSLDGMTGVDKHPDAGYSQPWGYVNYDGGGQVPAGTQLWVIGGNDKQVISGVISCV